ncbi:MAG TPA: hypothetical protein VFO67_02370 [Gemmatimonadales bacterium]|nr:hypothetical protein [Gemmatimonadales bacterium]
MPSKDVNAAIRLGATLLPGVDRVPSRHVDELIAADPATYYLKPHYEGYNAVLVRVSRIHPDALRDLLLMACRFVDATTKGRRTGRRPAPRAR